MRTQMKQAGFTLIEILVVLVIMSITISFAVLSLGNRDAGEPIAKEARRLTRLLSLASEEAILQSRQLALEISHNRYRFVAYDGQHWEAIQDDNLLRERKLPDGVFVDLDVEGDSVTIDNKRASTANRIYLFSSGEITPFTMTLNSADQRYRYELRGDALGQVKYVGEIGS